ncbi:MAG: ABC transporter ATP-binding protein [Clostridia bacterium]|nr:ABC transporter ATP-binding protein [Clostridia bacterium]
MASKKIDKNTLKRLFKNYIFKYYKFRFFLVMVLVVVSALAGVASSLFIENLIDDYITPLLKTDNPVFTPLLKALAVMACIYLVGVVASYVYQRMMSKIAQGTLKVIRDEMFEKMQKLPIEFYDSHTNGEIMSYYTNDVDTLTELISRGLPMVFRVVVTVISTFIAMCVTSIYLTAVVIAVIFIMMKVTKIVGGRSANYFMEQQKSISKVDGYIEEMINGQKVVKVFSHEDEAIEGFKKINDKLCEDMTKANIYSNILGPTLANIGNLQFVLIGVLGGILAINGVGGLTIGMIASFLNLSKSFTMPITQLSHEINIVVVALAGAKRIFGLIDEEPEKDEGYVTLVNARKNENGELEEVPEYTGTWAWKHPHSDGRLEYIELKGYIEFFDVDFAYTPGKTILHDISLYAKPGQKIAFVGATGAGKTTITNLINRFYDIEDGKIRYDGININKIKKADLRRSLGMVLQDVNLFTGTIKENIRYGNLEATDEEVVEAAKLANADGFIRMLPEGYDTKIDGNGGSLSQGQKQLISIARAAINNPPVMILDEATSSIDTRTEKIVQDGMDKLMNGRTVFVIAHRLSTVRNSKAIMVLDHGKIIERGNHKELIEQKGVYYKLYTGAFELE